MYLKKTKIFLLFIHVMTLVTFVVLSNFNDVGPIGTLYLIVSKKKLFVERDTLV